MKWDRLTVQITAEQASRMRRLAFDQRVSQAQIVRNAIDAYQTPFTVDSEMLKGDADDNAETGKPRVSN